MSLKSRYSFLERLNVDAIYSKFLGLPPQQQTIAIVASAALLLLIIILPISMASGKIGSMERALKENREAMDKIADVIDNYSEIQKSYEQMEKTLESGFDSALSSTVDSIATKKMNLDVKSIKPVGSVPSEFLDESSVDVSITKATLPQIIDLLYVLEYDKNKVLRINDINLKTRFDDKKLFDVRMQVSTYKLAKKEEKKETKKGRPGKTRTR